MENLEFDRDDAKKILLICWEQFLENSERLGYSVEGNPELILKHNSGSKNEIKSKVRLKT